MTTTYRVASALDRVLCETTTRWYQRDAITAATHARLRAMHDAIVRVMQGAR